MSVEYFWTLPVGGDGRFEEPSAAERSARPFGRDLADHRQGRYGSFDYLFQVARAALVAGFRGLDVPFVPDGDDSWIAAAGLAREARRLVFAPQVQPGFTTPVTFAKLTASFARLAGPRLVWNLDLEQPVEVRRALGDNLSGDDFFARAAEWLELSRAVFTRHPYDADGRFYAVKAGGLTGPLAGLPVPPIHTAGLDPRALALAGRLADLHLFDLAPQPELRRGFAALDEAARGRSVQRGMRLGLVARQTDEEAWRAVAEAWAQAGQRAPLGDLRREGQLFTGFDRLGLRFTSGLVGSYDTVATALGALAAMDVRLVVLDARPRLEEAYRLGEHVFPRLGAHAQPAALAA